MTQQAEVAEPGNVEAEGQNHEDGSDEQAVAALLGKPEAEESPETPEDEPTDEADEEPSDGEPDEEEAAEQLAEVEYEGKTYQVPPELEKALLRQSDYSRNMGEVAALKKTFAERIELIEGLEEVAEKRSEALAEVRALDKQIKAYDGVDWTKARADSPAEAALAAVELLSLKEARKDAANAAAQVARELTEGRKKLDADKTAEMAKVLDKDLPGWRGKVGLDISNWARANGFQNADIAAINDPRVVIALHKAAKFDALQKGKAELKATVKAPPVAKPGARRPVTNQATDAMSRFRKSNSTADAEAVFLARMK